MNSSSRRRSSSSIGFRPRICLRSWRSSFCLALGEKPRGGYSGRGSSRAPALKNRSWTCGSQLMDRSTRIGFCACTIWSQSLRRYSFGTRRR